MKYIQVPMADLTDKRSYTDKEGNTWTILPAQFNKAQAETVCNELNAASGNSEDGTAEVRAEKAE